LHRFSFPTAILFGVGACREVAPHLGERGCRRPLVVTDRGLAALPVFARFLDELKSLDAAVFSGVAGNPVRSQVMEGARAFRGHRADSIVGIGGGAALDVAKAIAPIIELISMSLRASRSWPSRTAIGSARAAMRTPSTAMPSHSGCHSGDRYDSTLCVSASIPVAAVIAAGKSTVSSGSANTALASSAGEKTIFFTCVVSSEITEERPTSDPVPAVVGTATKYGNALVIGRTCG
jgi:hypothetical protein